MVDPTYNRFRVLVGDVVDDTISTITNRDGQFRVRIESVWKDSHVRAMVVPYPTGTLLYHPALDPCQTTNRDHRPGVPLEDQCGDKWFCIHVNIWCAAGSETLLVKDMSIKFAATNAAEQCFAIDDHLLLKPIP